MISPDVRTELERGCALLLGTVDHDLRPRASRAWGVRIAEENPFIVRICVEDDPVTLASLAPGRRLALTCSTVDTYVSFQLKCRSLSVVDPDEIDRDTSRRQLDSFTADVARTDGMPEELVRLWARGGQRVCVAEVEQVFDQTPGPGAGRPVES